MSAADCRECFGLGGLEIRGGPGQCERCGVRGDQVKAALRLDRAQAAVNRWAEAERQAGREISAPAAPGWPEYEAALESYTAHFEDDV